MGFARVPAVFRQVAVGLNAFEGCGFRLDGLLSLLNRLVSLSRVNPLPRRTDTCPFSRDKHRSQHHIATIGCVWLHLPYDSALDLTGVAP